jgi:hypothetical protein
MKNKLYAFLGKRRMLLSGLLLATWVFMLFNSGSRQILGLGIMIFFVLVCLIVFLNFEDTNRSYAKALQLLEDQCNSSSPHWDGHVRSDADIEPRLKLLRDRIAQDQAELDWIVAQSQTHE